jgi:hypothetical protein
MRICALPEFKIGSLKIEILSFCAGRERGREQEQQQGYRRRRRWSKIGSSERDERRDDGDVLEIVRHATKRFDS